MGLLRIHRHTHNTPEYVGFLRIHLDDWYTPAWRTTARRLISDMDTAHNHGHSLSISYVRLYLKSALLLNVALYCNRLLMSLTQSSSLPGPTPSSGLPWSGSVIDDRLMQGTGYGDACTVTESPGFNTWETRPSIDTPAAARLRSLI